jgi:hypothetical protein
MKYIIMRFKGEAVPPQIIKVDKVQYYCKKVLPRLCLDDATPAAA